MVRISILLKTRNEIAVYLIATIHALYSFVFAEQDFLFDSK
jgi:hypothetical protein